MDAYEVDDGAVATADVVNVDDDGFDDYDHHDDVEKDDGNVLLIMMIFVMTMLYQLSFYLSDIKTRLMFMMPLLLPMSPHHLLCAYVCERKMVCGCARET